LKIDTIDVDAAIGSVKQLLKEEPDLSPALKSALEILLLLISVLLGRVALNSNNSSKPPSSDPNRKKAGREKSDKPSGAQTGHNGTTLKKIPDPDEIEVRLVDRKSLAKGNYREVGFKTRQVFDIDISRLVIEYRAQILKG